MSDKISSCARCSVNSKERACQAKNGTGPVFCPTRNEEAVIDRAKETCLEPATLEFAKQASIQEAECYINRDRKPYVRHPVKPRLQEIFEFAGRMGYKKLGLAFCSGLKKEAASLQKILEGQGFEVVSVICKVGCVPKEQIGLSDSQKVHTGQFEAMCNPVAQAEILNECKTEFNILVGLCVGHDSLFFKNAGAPTTVFAVKDRVLGHNPIAAIYTIGSYYERFET